MTVRKFFRGVATGLWLWRHYPVKHNATRLRQWELRPPRCTKTQTYRPKAITIICVNGPNVRAETHITA